MDSDSLDKSEPELKQPKICPRCYWNTANEYIEEPEKEDKYNFLRLVLSKPESNVRFLKTYSAFDNTMTITFRTRSKKESDMLMEQINIDTKNNRIYSNNHAESLSRLYMLALSLKSIRSPELNKDFPEINSQTYPPDKNETPLRNATRILLDDFSEITITVLMSFLAKFENLCLVLLNRMQNPDFWKATGE